MHSATWRGGLLPSAAAAIGGTPLVELRNLGARFGGRLLAKLENLNPGGSKKDRIARQIVEDAVNSGELAPGQPVVELTSGNTGTGLAIVCRAFGHPFTAVMSEGNSPERRVMMSALGAEVVLVPQAPGSEPGRVSGKDLALVEAAAQELVEERGAFRADQFHNDSAFRAHLENTGPEIWEQSGGKVDAFVDFVGSGSTLAGVSVFLKTKRRHLVSIGVEPAGAMTVYNSVPEDERGPLLGDAAHAELQPGADSHVIQGGGYSMEIHELPFLSRHRHVLDGFVGVTREDALEGARMLAAEEGILGGYSAGSNLFGAIQYLSTPEGRGKTCAFLVCDTGLKYLATSDLYDTPFS